MKYNLVNAVAYEITEMLLSMDPRWQSNHWVKLIRAYSFPDWVMWKTERTMADVDKQVEEIQQAMEKHDYETYIKPIVIEHEPDGSKAQELLGGTLQIKAPWLDLPKE